MEPEGHAATQAGLRQCSHSLGRYIMKVFSNSPYISFWMLAKFWSFERLRNSVPRISSQLGPHSIFSMRLRVTSERGRAVGGVRDTPAFCRCS